MALEKEAGVRHLVADAVERGIVGGRDLAQHLEALCPDLGQSRRAGAEADHRPRRLRPRAQLFSEKVIRIFLIEF